MSEMMLNLSSGPHVRDKWTTKFIMTFVTIALLPTAAVGIYANGLHAALILLTSVVTAVAAEFLFNKWIKQPNTISDRSAVVTGLLLGLTLSPSVPLYIPFLGSLFAIIVVKCCFGGIGRNFLNPALAARCFLLISFGALMTNYNLDGMTGATPVATLLAGKAVNVTKMFLGTGGGVIGSSIVAIMIGGLILWAFDIIHGEICFSVIGAFSLFILIFGGQGLDLRFLAAHLCGGGVMLGAFFMATDYTTSPVSRTGQLLYGSLVGILGGLFRIYGTSADSFSYAIIIANLTTPLIDMYIIPKPFAYRKDAIAARNGEVIHKKTLKDLVPKPVVALTTIALVAGIALSGVYSMTKERIEEQRKAANMASYKVVCPDAETFEVPDNVTAALEALGGEVYGSSFGRVYINDAVVGKNSDGEIVGYVISASSMEGNDGEVTLSLGLKPDGEIIGITFTTLNETPGMGMRCGDPEFTDQFQGKKAEKLTLVKPGSGGAEDTIDGISGATITSDASLDAVNAALDFFYNNMKEGE